MEHGAKRVRAKGWLVMQNDHDTPSTVFLIGTRNVEGQAYTDRQVNLDFEKRHLAMFKIVPPAVGSFLDLECLYKIDTIRYAKRSVRKRMKRSHRSIVSKGDFVTRGSWILVHGALNIVYTGSCDRNTW